MAASGAIRLFVKRLAPNDNSKNQVYLGGNFEVLNVLPFDKVYVDGGREGSKRDRFKANIFLGWLGPNGYVYEAPNSQLIMYPKYPEVRMSGFLMGCDSPPSELMQSRLERRLLFLGITKDGKIIGHVVSPDNPVSGQLAALKNLEQVGIFQKIPLHAKEKDTRELLVAALKEIHEKGWIDSMRLTADGTPKLYKAQNGGGYTLEAQLGITPNGNSDPDFEGWEVKQHGVSDFLKPGSSRAVTLMTPEPTGGVYRDDGYEAFMKRFGYPAKDGTPDRLNFGGTHYFEKRTDITGLTLRMPGYDPVNHKLIDPAEGLTLFDDNGVKAAIWYYSDLLKHWENKHAQAVYVPSMKQEAGHIQYRYGNLVEVGVGADILIFLRAIAEGIVYYDPGCNLKKISTANPIPKKRSQFRVAHKNLKYLYKNFEVVDITKS